MLALEYAADGKAMVSSGFDTGSRLSIGGLGGALNDFSRWPIGPPVPCWFDPEHPQDVVVIRGFGGAYVRPHLPSRVVCRRLDTTSFSVLAIDAFRAFLLARALICSDDMRRTVLATMALMPLATAAVGALNLISVRDEIALGQRAQQDVRRQVPEFRDRVVSSYIESLGRRIAARADGPRFPYSFDVANRRDVNAFALPGGPIWINRGTIDAAQSEAQLAGVIAHEVAHIANRHAAEQITKGTFANVGLGILGAVLGGGGTASQMARMGAGVAAQATMMKFSRDDEREADMKALQYMKRAGYDPRGMVEFLRVLRARQGRDPGAVSTFFASHPAPAERVRRLEQQANRLAGGRRTSTSFQQVQTRLDRLGR